MNQTKKKVIFLHPDLGVGGAERLVVDAALSLKKCGYSVEFITAHHNVNHCFEETKDGSLTVKVVGDFLPRQIFGRFFALCAYIRMLYCALYIVLFTKPDVVFCDLISICIPVLKYFVPKVVFYCHFPDQLLSRREGFLKKLYRLPIDWMEEKTTGKADKLFVNSAFTKSVFCKTFPSITISPDILYPSINTKPFDSVSENRDDLMIKVYDFPSKAFVFLSINRYERKKNVELAIKALCKLKEIISLEEWNRVRLVIAGGYDERVTENLEYYKELKKLATDLQIPDKVLFLKSPSDSEKVKLLKNSNCILYTPSNEHFGIVPLEAMYCGKPVVAVNSGGPTETVVNGETGFLCPSSDYDFSQSMASLMVPQLAKSMGEKGKQRFLDKFSFDAFSEHLNKAITELINS